MIDEIARQAGATLTVYPIHDNERPFRRHFVYMMQAHRLGPSDLPPWMAEIFDRYDREAFSPRMPTDPHWKAESSSPSRRRRDAGTRGRFRRSAAELAPLSAG